LRHLCLTSNLEIDNKSSCGMTLLHSSNDFIYICVNNRLIMHFRCYFQEYLIIGRGSEVSIC
jgi:hypothetical protein